MKEVAVRRIWMGMVAGLLAVAMTGCERDQHPNHIGRIAPEFVVSDATRTVDLNKLRGKVVVLNLWATWCAPCVQELPSLLAMQHELPDVVVVAVSSDQDDGVYRQFLERRHVDFLTVRDESQRINALYGTVQIPETYVIDRQGVLRRKFVSAQDWTSPEIVKYLRTL